MSLFDILGVKQLGADINKLKEELDRPDEGISGDTVPELELELDDEELLDLARDWEKDWKQEEQSLSKKREENRRYWAGDQGTDLLINKHQAVDNRIGVSLETLIPIATRANAEPVVTAENDEDGNKVASHIQDVLGYHADFLRMKLKMKRLTRHWALDLVGVLKPGWSMKIDDLSMVVVSPQNVILDPDAFVDERGVYSGEYVGFRRSDTAAALSKRFPDHKGFIKEKVSGKMGTKLHYTEWWTDEFVFWKLQDKILSKAKNPHWNYDSSRIEETVDVFGNATEEEVTVRGRNHLPHPMIPAIFLSVFNLGGKPYDEFDIVGQAIPIQDLINKRIRQIDLNVSRVNGGWSISSIQSGLDEKQATRAMNSLNEGLGVYSHSENAATVAAAVSGKPLPSDHFNTLQDYRAAIDNLFGTHATTRGERAQPETASGRILLKQSDESRIGSVTEALEQVYDTAYNWLVQLIFVYYDESKLAAILGPEKAREVQRFIDEDLNRKITVSVKEGSLVPRDEFTRRNEAVELWGAGAIDPLTLYEKLDYPDPEESVRRLMNFQQGNLQGLLPQDEAAPLIPPEAQPQGAATDAQSLLGSITQ